MIWAHSWVPFYSGRSGHIAGWFNLGGHYIHCLWFMFLRFLLIVNHHLITRTFDTIRIVRLTLPGSYYKILPRCLCTFVFGVDAVLDCDIFAVKAVGHYISEALFVVSQGFALSWCLDVLAKYHGDLH